MSLSSLQCLIFDLKHDEERAAMLRTNPEQVLAAADLTEEERKAMASGDVAALYRMGVHPLLIRPYSRMVGVPLADYQKVLDPLKGSRTFSSAYDLAGGRGV